MVRTKNFVLLRCYFALGASERRVPVREVGNSAADVVDGAILEIQIWCELRERITVLEVFVKLFWCLPVLLKNFPVLLVRVRVLVSV